jgi:hypothetical protein
MGFHSSKTRQAWSILQADLSTVRGALQLAVKNAPPLSSAALAWSYMKRFQLHGKRPTVFWDLATKSLPLVNHS